MQSVMAINKALYIIHGGLLCELADAAIGTAHSTLMGEGETFTSIDLKATFLRPVCNLGCAPMLALCTREEPLATIYAKSHAKTAKSWQVFRAQ